MRGRQSPWQCAVTAAHLDGDVINNSSNKNKANRDESEVAE